MHAWKALQEAVRRIPTRNFNRTCIVFAFLWLAISVPVGIKKFPTWADFSQFYMGGLITRYDQWGALYPIPRPSAADNPGLSVHSFPKIQWDVLRKFYQVPDQTRFILPPPSALLFVPFTYTNYARAFWMWTAILTASVFAIGLIAAHIHRTLVGRVSHLEGVIVLLIALSPMTARAIRIENVSPALGLLIGLALLTLLHRNQPIRGAVYILLGALLKYATLILAPLLIAMRQWRLLAWLTGLGTLVLLITLKFSGVAPFKEFITQIMPTLSRPSLYQGNQSLAGLMVRLFGRPLPEPFAFGLTFIRMMSLGAIFLVLMRLRPRDWLNPANVIAGVAIMISWLLIFSPIAWEHWPIFLCPVWGWLIWEARWPGWRRGAALASLALMYFPQGIFGVSGIWRTTFSIPEPFNSAQLFGVMGVLSLALRRLAERSSVAHMPVLRTPRRQSQYQPSLVTHASRGSSTA